MTDRTGTIKIWFCVAVALIAASIADPFIEWASNSGWFGRGDFTDHSTWDVVPVFLVGLLFVGLHLALRISKSLAASGPSQTWARLTNAALGARMMRHVPLIYAAQISALFLMETAEQQVVYGHVLGGTLWLGGPIAVSLLVHAAICALLAASASAALRALADATVDLVRYVRASATLPATAAQAAFLRMPDLDTIGGSSGAPGSIGLRAPPLILAI